MKASVVTTALALATLALACHKPKDVHEREDAPARSRQMLEATGTTTLTGASWVANDAAVDRIVAARCAREITCSNVGPDKHFGSGDVCLREVKKKLATDLASSECPGGIDGKELDECLDAIRNESCTNALDTITRLAACRTSDLCMTMEAPRR